MYPYVNLCIQMALQRRVWTAFLAADAEIGYIDMNPRQFGTPAEVGVRD